MFYITFIYSITIKYKLLVALVLVPNCAIGVVQISDSTFQAQYNYRFYCNYLILERIFQTSAVYFDSNIVRVHYFLNSCE